MSSRLPYRRLSSPIALLATLTFAVATPARASVAAQMIAGGAAACAGVGLPIAAASRQGGVALGIGGCLGTAFSAVMALGMMPAEARAEIFPLATTAFTLLALSAGTSLFVPGWELEDRTRLVAASTNALAMGMGLWIFSGLLIGSPEDTLRLGAPGAIGVAAAATLVSGAGGFLLGTTDARTSAISMVPLVGFFAGQLGVFTYAIVQLARDEPASPMVAGSFIAGGLALGSVVGLLIAAASRGPGIDEATGSLSVAPMGLGWTF